MKCKIVFITQIVLYIIIQKTLNNQYPNTACLPNSKFERIMIFSFFQTFKLLMLISYEGVQGEDYINGGKYSQPSEFPFIVRLKIVDRNKLEWSCTGSLLGDERTIATAWHCASKCIKGRCYAIFNDHKTYRKDVGEYQIRFQVSRKSKPPRPSDLALINLPKRAFHLDGTPQETVEIATSVPKKGGKVIAVGYGMDGIDSHSDGLKSVELEVALSKDVFIYTKVGPNNEDPCGGDSGGPILVKVQDDWKLVATVLGGGYDCRTGETLWHQQWNLIPGVVKQGWIKNINKKRQREKQELE